MNNTFLRTSLASLLLSGSMVLTNANASSDLEDDSTWVQVGSTDAYQAQPVATPPANIGRYDLNGLQHAKRVLLGDFTCSVFVPQGYTEEDARQQFISQLPSKKAFITAYANGGMNKTAQESIMKDGTMVGYKATYTYSGRSDGALGYSFYSKSYNLDVFLELLATQAVLANRSPSPSSESDTLKLELQQTKAELAELKQAKEMAKLEMKFKLEQEREKLKQLRAEVNDVNAYSKEVHEVNKADQKKYDQLSEILSDKVIMTQDGFELLMSKLKASEEREKVYKKQLTELEQDVQELEEELERAHSIEDEYEEDVEPSKSPAPSSEPDETQEIIDQLKDDYSVMTLDAREKVIHMIIEKLDNAPSLGSLNSLLEFLSERLDVLKDIDEDNADLDAEYDMLTSIVDAMSETRNNLLHAETDALLDELISK